MTTRATAPSPTERRAERRRGLSLFWRLFAGIAAMLVVCVVLVGLLTALSARRWDSEWVETTTAQIRTLTGPDDDHADDDHERGSPQPRRRLSARRPADMPPIEASLRALGEALDADLRVVKLGTLRRGATLADGAVGPELDAQRIRRLARGETVVLSRGRWSPPRLLVPTAFTEDLPRLVVIVDPHPRFMWRRMLVAVAGVVLTLGAWILARGMTRRIAALEAHADALSRGELDAVMPLAARGPGDELDALAAAFAEMSERIRDLVSGQRRLLTNVSHELRTPLARMRVQVELLGDELTDAWPEARIDTNTDERADATAPATAARAAAMRHLDALCREIDETATLVADLLVSGRLELGRDATLRRARVDLQGLARDRAARHGAGPSASRDADGPGGHAAAGGAGSADRGDDPGDTSFAVPFVVLGDPALLTRVLDNLLANARRASGEGDVWIDVARDGADVVVAVTDDGPGVPATAREAIFEAFVRLDDARARDAGGAGLGLFLARQIAEAHGGSLRVTERRDGQPGARFELRLPAASPPSEDMPDASPRVSA